MPRMSIARPGATYWTTLAGGVLALQGFGTIVYAGFLPPPLSDAGISLPLLGHVPFVWMATGLLAIAAALGVLRRDAWGRVLGIGSEILAVLMVSIGSTSIRAATPTLVIAGVVLFALWRRWPVSEPPGEGGPEAPGR